MGELSTAIRQFEQIQMQIKKRNLITEHNATSTGHIKSVNMKLKLLVTNKN